MFVGTEVGFFYKDITVSFPLNGEPLINLAYMLDLFLQGSYLVKFIPDTF
jgi:hypothetical protein